MPQFSHYVAIDWSGAKGNRHPGICVAMCRPGSGAPQIVRPGHVWSRRGVLDWLRQRLAAGHRPLVGIDFSFAPPFVGSKRYFRHSRVPARSGPALWQWVNESCHDEDLGAASFIEKTHRPEFYLGPADGQRSEFKLLRTCEVAFNAGGGGKPSSIFDSMGAAQVAKASFAGMRLLHAARTDLGVPVWPFDALPDQGPLLVEIYTRCCIRHAGQRGIKIRDAATLATALKTLGSQNPRSLSEPLTDHITDALLSAAAIRLLANNPAIWIPPAMTPEIASTEGWTFGVP